MHHTPEKNVLNQVCLEIPNGSAVGFVGSTGSGKTTLINTLLGVLDPQKGSILVDGVDIQTNLDGWRANIGYILQVIFLMVESIRRNIAFGVPDELIDDEKVMEAARAAQLEEFIGGIKKGLDSVVGESGVRISGGQRQRLGLARALYNNPQVLVMDEATSSLDNQTESLVMEALNQLRSERTFIMIAHRLSTVRDCDVLYFLKEGEIVGRGTYDELIEAHSEFRQMTEVDSS